MPKEIEVDEVRRWVHLKVDQLFRAGRFRKFVESFARGDTPAYSFKLQIVLDNEVRRAVEDPVKKQAWSKYP